MKKCWKWILAAVAILLVGLLIWFIFLYTSVPRLSKKEKEKVEQVYFEEWLGADEQTYQQCPLIWYDENGYSEQEFVWRYVGTYGECYAFLLIGDNQTAYMEDVEIPFPINGLARVVYYSTEADVILYHTSKEFTYKSEYGDDEYKKRLDHISNIDRYWNREEWLTDAQLEELTRDIENLAKGRV